MGKVEGNKISTMLICLFAFDRFDSGWRLVSLARLNVGIVSFAQRNVFSFCVFVNSTTEGE